ncbi:hypothetical protein G5B35_03650 [Parapusillimonas sp. SGNA-6]|nr:hypothetical protein [Parapusillimonas sp. SGNA-6]
MTATQPKKKTVLGSVRRAMLAGHAVFCVSLLSTSGHAKGTAMNTLHPDITMVRHGVR